MVKRKQTPTLTIGIKDKIIKSMKSPIVILFLSMNFPSVSIFNIINANRKHKADIVNTTNNMLNIKYTKDF